MDLTTLVCVAHQAPGVPTGVGVGVEKCFSLVRQECWHESSVAALGLLHQLQVRSSCHQRPSAVDFFVRGHLCSLWHSMCSPPWRSVFLAGLHPMLNGRAISKAFATRSLPLVMGEPPTFCRAASDTGSSVQDQIRVIQRACVGTLLVVAVLPRLPQCTLRSLVSFVCSGHSRILEVRPQEERTFGMTVEQLRPLLVQSGKVGRVGGNAGSTSTRVGPMQIDYRNPDSQFSKQADHCTSCISPKSRHHVSMDPCQRLNLRCSLRVWPHQTPFSRPSLP